MNFFKLYIGDYQRDTGALSIAEHGAYFLMLQYHYATEKPLPQGKDLYRLLRCEGKADRDAVDAVARQFWHETPEGLINNRAAEEIAKAGEQADTNRRIAQAREDKRKAQRTQHEPLHEPCSVREPSHSHSHNQITKSQKLSSASADPPPGFVKFWNAWPRSERKQGKAKCLGIWKRKALEGKAESVVAHVAHMAKSESWQTGFDPMPETYLNGDRWDGADLSAPSGAAKPWTETWPGIVQKGKELGIEQQDGEAAPFFKARVMEAAL